MNGFGNWCSKSYKSFLLSDEALKATQQEIAIFATGFGTVLFFEDSQVINDLQEQFPLYADYFPVWSEHSTGIAQFAVWTALAEQGEVIFTTL
jgi:predicted oxidoreductase (fatty acid repression mutant protein)